MNASMALLLLLGLTATLCQSQTLVHFSPSEGYSHNTPVAAGFAYAFRTPTVAAKSFDAHKSRSIYYSPRVKTYETRKVSHYEVPQKNTVVPVYYATPTKNVYSQAKNIEQYVGIPQVVKTQYHSQDELGQYAYGYVHNDASHHEERSIHGGVTGSYSYYDKDGVKQSTKYEAGRQGFRVQTSNHPVVKPVPVTHTPEVKAATFAHLQAVEKVRARKKHGRQIHVGIGETPEVAAARAAHMHAFNKIKQDHARRWRRSAHRSYNSPSHGSVNYHQQPAQHPFVPVSPTPAVQAATYQHLQAVAQSQKYGGNVHVGIPDTPAVAAARDAHLHAYDHIARDHAKRWRRSAHRSYNSPSHGSVNYHQQPAQHPFVPVSPTPAVQAATYQHLQAVAQSQKYGGNVHVGIPDTPAVAAAREAHFHAYNHIVRDHAKRRGRNAHYSPESHIHYVAPVQCYSPNSPSTHSVSGKSVADQSVSVHKKVTAPEPLILKQYHSQNELGHYAFGYSGGPSGRHEEKGKDGVTRGHYSYVDAYGNLQKVEYEADDYTGFKIVSATNLPQPIKSY